MKIIRIFLILMSQITIAQVGINTSTPDNSAALDITSNSNGLLIPRMTVNQRNDIPSKTIGLIVFNLTSGLFNYYDGSAWLELTSVNPCIIMSSPLQFQLSMEKGSSKTISFNLTNSIGDGGSLSTSLLSTSPGIDLTINSITNNNLPAPVNQEITFTLETSSTGILGSTGIVIVEITSDCNSTIQIPINITIIGCELEIDPSDTIAFTSAPSTGSKTVTFAIPIFQNGTYPGLVTAVFNDQPNIIETLYNNPCGYTCQMYLELEFDNTLTTGTYDYDINLTSSCGYTNSITYSLIVNDVPRNCAQILTDNPAAVDGDYEIDVDGTGPLAPLTCTCDMTTDGGGWTLILNYLHQAATSPDVQVRETSLPLLGSTTLGVDESGTSYWGHASNSMMANLSFNDMRFYASTSMHERVIHFKNNQTQMKNYFQTGLGQINFEHIRTNSISLTGQNANLPFVNNSGFANQGESAMLYPFRATYVDGIEYRWYVQPSNNRWHVDDYLDPASSGIPSTHHQIWVR